MWLWLLAVRWCTHNQAAQAIHDAKGTPYNMTGSREAHNTTRWIPGTALLPANESHRDGAPDRTIRRHLAVAVAVAHPTA